jgi:soluble lytic murein transglycosylase
MAIQIPSQTGPSVRSRGIGAPQVRAQPVDGSANQLGQQVLSAAGQVFQKSRDDADTAALIEAEAKLSNWKLNTMFNADNGVYSRKGANALDITNQTLPQFDQQADEIGNSLTNERQRARWNQISSGQRQSLNGELNRYEFGERQTFYEETDKASLNSAQAGAMAYYQDPEQIAYYQNKGARVIAANGQRKGLPLEAVEQNVRSFNSSIATGVVERMTVDDPMKAQQYFATAAEYMTPEDRLKTTELLGTAVRQQLGNEIGRSLATQGDGGDAALTNLIIQAESSGDPTAVSPKGARGLMQLMPDTAKEMAAELGIPYSEERLTADPNYNMALGNAYLNKMVGRYGGDKTLAIAAYNAGPGSVDKWLKKYGDPRTGEITTEEFIAKIPFKETREYTQKITGQMGAPASPDRRYADGMKWLNENVQDAKTRKYAQDTLDDWKKASDLESKATYEEAAKVVLDQGFNAVPPAMINSIPADEQAKLMRLDDMRRKGLEPETDDKKLQEFITMPTAQLAALSIDRDIRPYLNGTDFKRVLSAYQSAQKGDGVTQKAQAAEYKSVQSVMGLAGIMFGTSKDAQSEQNKRNRAQFENSYNQLRDAFVEKNKTEPSPQEAQKIAEQLLVEVRMSGTGFFSPDRVPAWQVKAGQENKAFIDPEDIDVNDLTPNERQQAVERLRAGGVQQITDETITEAYLQILEARGLKVNR